jgi:hypothetical protein
MIIPSKPFDCKQGASMDKKYLALYRAKHLQ